MKTRHRIEHVEQFILRVGRKIAQQQGEFFVPQNLLSLPCVSVSNRNAHNEHNGGNEEHSQKMPSVVATNGSHNEGLAGLGDIAVRDNASLPSIRTLLVLHAQAQE